MKAILATVLSLVFCVKVCGTAAVYVNPDDIVTTSTAQINLEIRISDVTNLTASSSTIYFNENVLQYVGVTFGTFFTSNPIQLVNPPSGFHPDYLIVDQAMLGGETVSGSGLLFTVHFQPIHSGISEIELSTILQTTGGAEIPHTTQGGSVNILAGISVKFFLQGPFSGGVMNTSLNSGGLIPLQQPYNVDPWNYAGDESVSALFFDENPSVVDWILIDLRSDVNPEISILRKTVFVTSGGNLLGLDGSESIKLEIAAGNYYLVMYHRNHVPVMSGLSINVDINTDAYDFTAASNSAFGTNAQKELSPGVFGLYSGDSNGDGYVTSSDFNIFYTKFRTSASGYESTDWNLDGFVTSSDFNLFYSNFRAGVSSQLP